MATSVQIETFERRFVITIWVVMFLVILAGFAGILLAHGNTLAIVDPLVRWFRPSASATDVLRVHDTTRKLGHFLVPAVAFALLVIGPLRRHPLIALGLCALFATIDEFLQTFIPGRSGSLLDVILDTTGALFAYFVYRAIVNWPRTRRIPSSPRRQHARR
jgi:VanZ family protein